MFSGRHVEFSGPGRFYVGGQSMVEQGVLKGVNKKRTSVRF